MFLCILYFASYSNAQTSITGRVTDADSGDPLVGANMLVKGTTTGSITDFDGNYTLLVDQPDAIIVFKFIGYKQKEIELVEGQSLYDVQLEVEASDIDEVIVVAYGKTSREAATGSLGVLGNDDIESANVSSAMKALQGKVAGVHVGHSSGQPGVFTQVFVRGMSSINADNRPLYVVDGVPVVSGDYSAGTFGVQDIMSTYNPDDIESITILKDAAAASIYGSRAANGVVMINTKSGTKGKTKFEVRLKGGVSTLSNDQGFRMMNSKELLDWSRTALTNANQDPDVLFPETLLNRPQHDWVDNIFRVGDIRDIGFSASGGDEKNKFFISLGYYKEDGILIGNDYERYNATINFEHKASNLITIGARFKGAFMKSSDFPQNLYYAYPIFGAMRMLPWVQPYNADGSYNWNNEMGNNSGYNILGLINSNERFSQDKRFSPTLYLELNPIKGLKFRTTNSLDYFVSNGRFYWAEDTPVGVNNGGGFPSETINQNLDLQMSNTLEYTTQISNHGIRALIGHEIQYTKYNSLEAWAEGGVTDLLPYVGLAPANNQFAGERMTEFSMVSVFGTADYNYADKYIVTGSLRWDATSRFSPDTRWGTFYSLGASWNLHNESFLSDLEAINLLKLRTSYGTSGNFNIGDYEFYGSYASATYNGTNTYYPGGEPNDNLTWEKSKELNIGLDIVVFKRINASIDAYDRKTEDMLLNVPLPLTSGDDYQRQNIGALRNTGIEFSVDGDVVKTPDLSVNIGFNIAHNKTEILDLAGADTIEVADSYNRAVHVVGGPHMQWYLYDWAGVNPATGAGMWYNEDGKLTEEVGNARKIVTGQIAPKFIGGFSLKASWKGLLLSAQFEYKLGHYLHLMESGYSRNDGVYIGENVAADQLDYWKQPGDIVSVPKPVAYNTSGSNITASTRYLQKGDYLSLKSLALSYSLPLSIVQKVGLSSANIFVEGNNLYYWHDISYWNPERPYTAYENLTYPMAKKVLFGIKLGF